MRTLILEVSGSRKSPGPSRAKAATARDQWCTAVNNYGGFGRWGYAELTDISDATGFVAEAIRNLYADAPVIGAPSESSIKSPNTHQPDAGVRP